MASDGVWDVMSNKEVVDFVEYYRGHCLKSPGCSARRPSVAVNQANIAQLLCEEARARWLTILEHEPSDIDDISCVVIELGKI